MLHKHTHTHTHTKILYNRKWGLACRRGDGRTSLLRDTGGAQKWGNHTHSDMFPHTGWQTLTRSFQIVTVYLCFLKLCRDTLRSSHDIYQKTHGGLWECVCAIMSGTSYLSAFIPAMFGAVWPLMLTPLVQLDWPGKYNGPNTEKKNFKWEPQCFPKQNVMQFIRTWSGPKTRYDPRSQDVM